MSNLNRNKGGHLLRYIAEELPEIQFRAVQGVYCDQEEEYPANVRVLPPTPRFEDLLAGARMVICPSLYESYGMVAVQACAAGVPVVASGTPGLREALGDAGWFVPLEQREMLDYWIQPIKALMTNDELWEHWSEKARERGKSLAVEEIFSIEHVISQMECLVR